MGQKHLGGTVKGRGDNGELCRCFGRAEGRKVGGGFGFAAVADQPGGFTAASWTAGNGKGIDVPQLFLDGGRFGGNQLTAATVVNFNAVVAAGVVAGGDHDSAKVVPSAQYKGEEGHRHRLRQSHRRDSCRRQNLRRRGGKILRMVPCIVGNENPAAQGFPGVFFLQHRR